MSREDHIRPKAKHEHEQLINFISGLLAGFISVTICNPLDIARTRLNVLVLNFPSRMHQAITVVPESILIFLMPCQPSGNKKGGEDFTAVPV